MNNNLTEEQWNKLIWIEKYPYLASFILALSIWTNLVLLLVILHLL